ncbi:MAG: hypothetical protein ACPIOQ_66825, partial [Promethearchaeia archaeon]
MVQGRQNLRTPPLSACSHSSWRVRPANWSKNGKGRENGRGRYAGTPRPCVFEEAAESTALLLTRLESIANDASPPALCSDPSWFWQRKVFFSGHSKRLKLDTGTPEPEV